MGNLEVRGTGKNLEARRFQEITLVNDMYMQSNNGAPAFCEWGVIKALHDLVIRRPVTGMEAKAWNQRGTSLIEILIVIGLLGIALMGLSAMTLGTIRGVSRSYVITTATTLARDKIEQVKRSSYDDIIPGNYPQEDYNSMVGYETFKRSIEIDDDIPKENMKTITVLISWKDESGSIHNFQLISAISR